VDVKLKAVIWPVMLWFLFLGNFTNPVPAAGQASGDPTLQVEKIEETEISDPYTSSLTYLPSVFSNFRSTCQGIPQSILAMFGPSLIAYYPLWETSGDMVVDLSPHNNHGLYEGFPVLNHIPALCGGSPAFDGMDDRADLFSPALASVFNGREGTAIIQLKLDSEAWGDGKNAVYLSLRADDDNNVIFYKSGTNQLEFTYTAGGRRFTTTYNNLSTDKWLTYAITWSRSKDRFLGYVAGEAIYPAQSGLGSWAGELTSAELAGHLESSTYFARGSISSLVLLDREATPAEVRQVSSTFGATGVLSVLGDSISRVYMTTPWSLQTVFEYQGGNKITLKNHAVSGETIMDHMDAQAVAAALDDADIIILALGAVDDNSGDMIALQAEVEENIAELRLSNPRASLYYMNILPLWKEKDCSEEVDKSNIRAAISAACTSQAITCWDTYSTPWITPADTNDGVHPNANGQAKIALQVLQRLP
jgi:lysophospholipase L1-like esterase